MLPRGVETADGRFLREYTDEDRAEWLKLYEKGLIDREISDATGVPKSTITHWRDRYGLESNFTKQYRRRPELVEDEEPVKIRKVRTTVDRSCRTCKNYHRSECKTYHGVIWLNCPDWVEDDDVR